MTFIPALRSQAPRIVHTRRLQAVNINMTMSSSICDLGFTAVQPRSQMDEDIVTGQNIYCSA